MTRFIFISCIVFLFSCKGNKEVEIPENILDKDKMTDVLVDIHLLEASMGLNIILPNDTNNKNTNMFYNIFETNQITKKQYDESMRFYMDHPKLLNQLYDTVLVKLEGEKNKLAKPK